MVGMMVARHAALTPRQNRSTGRCKMPALRAGLVAAVAASPFNRTIEIRPGVSMPMVALGTGEYRGEQAVSGQLCLEQLALQNTSIINRSILC